MSRVTVLLATLLATLVLPVPPGIARAAGSTEIRTGSYNIRADRTTQQFRRAVAAFRSHVDVAGLQEVNTGDKTRVLTHMRGWRSYRPDRLRQNPVIWRRDVFARVAAHGAKIAKGRWVGHEKRGTDPYRRAQWATVVRLRHRPTGRVISVIDTHPVAGGVQGGRCVPDNPRLCDLYMDSMSGLARTVAREQRRADAVYVLGDLNDNYPADRRRHHRRLAYATLTRAGLVAHWERRREIEPGQGSGARSGAYLDQIWAPVLPRRISVERSIDYSDHYPVVAVYR